ncbi:MAG: molybdenum cofactor guanylyltransferase MobA [Alphaproteobacteria bacterium]|nr:molybdenum cofactor guanylyltransferase MobA [Alphaproteobacteria bacterium]
MITLSSIVAVVLAGGQGRRMGHVDKPLLKLAGRPLLRHVLDRMAPQVQAMAINANGSPDRFAEFNLPVVEDSAPGFLGPLAGILAGLDWAARAHPAASHVMSIPGDAPFIPRDLVARLAAEATEGGFARAHSFGRRHPVVGLWPVAVRADLRDQLVNHDIRKIDLFTSSYPVAEVEFDGVPDPFFNVNTPRERDEAERILKNLPEKPE